MTATEMRPPTCADVYDELLKIYEKSKTFNRLLTTDARIGQTPKTLVWTLNKAKLYHYAPVVPKEQRPARTPSFTSTSTPPPASRWSAS